MNRNDLKEDPMPNLSLTDQTTEFLLYTAANGKVKVEVLLNNETIWLTQKRMAELFGVGVPAISKHLKNIFESGELQEEVVISILENTTAHAEYELFNKQQKIESDFDHEVKKLLSKKDK